MPSNSSGAMPMQADISKESNFEGAMSRFPTAQVSEVNEQSDQQSEQLGITVILFISVYSLLSYWKTNMLHLQPAPTIPYFYSNQIIQCITHVEL